MIWFSHKQDPCIIRKFYPTLMNLKLTTGSRQYASDIWYKFCELCPKKKKEADRM